MTKKYKLSLTPRFKRDYKRLKRQHKISKINEIKLLYVLKLLQRHHHNFRKLRKHYDDHQLHGNEQKNRELHIANDLLIKYQIHHNELVLVLLRIGSHGGNNSVFK